MAAEKDRLQMTQNQSEAEQLRNGYNGSVRDAESTMPEDKATIMEELATSGLEEQVDYAIEVLLVAGASTKTLRSMMQRTGMVDQAAY
eukprot:CAMPEP_0198562870 /NCGR_PEP_ID=MMETSP1462-20131121/97844_1 /TAXON_ID=1333877 /ORGANISM="Brandtodinium nutriculum, Strain RCC3387" /LENGTH=87 /DNA_ID=CAMNT_0044293807 /DNA_START=11 /DNA_END=271 /DNA_ORIENTATION=-